MKVTIAKAKAFEIDPSKKYILVLDMESGLNQDDILKVNKQLREWGADGISILLRSIDSIRVVEL